MQKRHKDLLRNLVVELRHILVGMVQQDGTVRRGDLDRELERLGVAPYGKITSLDAISGIKEGERRTYRVVTSLLLIVPWEKRAALRAEIVERAAYTWINRLLALRAMEARNLIDNTLRDNDDYRALSGQMSEHISERLYLLYEIAPERTTAADKGWWAVIEDACVEQAQALPDLFALDEPSAALRPSASALLQCIALVGGRLANFTLEEMDAAFADPDVIGWAYQFYQEESKERIYAKLSKGGKATTRTEISAATQLFTEPYMVQWLLQNSLGRSYHEYYSHSKLPETWPYYIRPERLNAANGMPLEKLTLLDPCMGSGHFLRAAFDMLVAMYQEQHPELDMATIATRILDKHLYGIDIDPRATQLTELTLYLRARELIREEQSRKRIVATDTYILPTRNLATTPNFFNRDALRRHLQRDSQDRMLKSLLDSIFTEIEQADILGSLLRPGEYLDKTIDDLRQDHTIELEFDPEEAEFRRNVAELARSDRGELKQLLLERAIASFTVATNDREDMSAVLSGHEAIRGARLLQVLMRRYAVVVTNPPYMGSKNMDAPLKKFVEKHYAPGKRDLYAAFILRCLELCKPNGRIGMVTMQSWMFLRSYAELRALPEKKLVGAHQKGRFTGLLRASSIELLAHLGPNAFEEISGEVVQGTMFTLANRRPARDHKIVAFRLVGLRGVKEKTNVLQLRVPSTISNPKQTEFFEIPESPIVYWLRPRFFELLRSQYRLYDVADVRQGLATTDNDRFLRYFWEVGYLNWSNWDTSTTRRWLWYAKGGRYQKWSGLEWFVADWNYDGAAIKALVVTLPGTSHWSRRVASRSYYFRSGITYTLMARGSFGARVLNEAIFDVASISIFPTRNISSSCLASLTSTRIVSYLLRVTTQDLKFHAGYVAKLPLSTNADLYLISTIGRLCTALKDLLVAKDPTERRFTRLRENSSNIIETVLHTIEGWNEYVVSQSYHLDKQDVQAVIDETGTPAGWYPLITDYDSLPPLPEDIILPPLPKELFDYLTTHERISLDNKELDGIKAKLQSLYEAGPGTRNVEQDKNSNILDDESEETEGITLGAHIPIPTETFLEELSVKMKLHPISVYWLLEELRKEGACCLSEERRFLEDRLSVLVLRLLGHRWPNQLEADEPVPPWAESTGIIPLVPVPERATLAERLRGLLRAEDGDRETQQTERLLIKLTNMNIEQWLRRRFFERHVSQFKSRPVAWHLVSTPLRAAQNESNDGIFSEFDGELQNIIGSDMHSTNDNAALNKTDGKQQGKRRARRKRVSNAQRVPAFECLLYYHACSSDVLARIRTQYVDPLLRAERSKISSGTLQADDEGAAIAHVRIKELETFAQKLRAIEEKGFDCPELQQLLATEPLDRWSGNGYLPPMDKDELYHNEQVWHVDINDGVRVNIAPLQLARVLAADVLKLADARKVLAERARWRADEREWVREGKLPRCGWMDEHVPPSEEWLKQQEQKASGPGKIEQQYLLSEPGTSHVLPEASTDC